VQAEVGRLQRLERAHSRNQAMLTATRERAHTDADRARHHIDELRAVLPRLVDTSGDRFRMQIGEATYTSRADAARAVADWSHQARLRHAPGYHERDHGVVGQISSFNITVATRPTLGGVEVVVSLAGVPRSRFSLDRDTFIGGGGGVIQRIENRAAGIPTYLADATRDLEAAEQTMCDTDERISAPFRYADALHDAQARLAEINQQLEALHDTPDADMAEVAATRHCAADGRPSAHANDHRPPPAPLDAYGTPDDHSSHPSSLAR
jgi:hypothetical protein